MSTNQCNLVLFDIDGVLANDGHRSHFADAGQWADYFHADRMVVDGLWAPGYDLLNAAYASRDVDRIGCLTGRREDSRKATEKWMNKNRIYVDYLIMRAFDDRRALPIVKTEAVSVLTKMYKSVKLYDDDAKIVNLVNEKCGREIAFLCDWVNRPDEYSSLIPVVPDKIMKPEKVSSEVLSKIDPELADFFEWAH